MGGGVTEPEDGSATGTDFCTLSSYLNPRTQGQDAPGKNSLTQDTRVHYGRREQSGRASRKPAHRLNSRRHTHLHTPSSAVHLLPNLSHSALRFSPPPLYLGHEKLSLPHLLSPFTPLSHAHSYCPHSLVPTRSPSLSPHSATLALLPPS